MRVLESMVLLMATITHTFAFHPILPHFRSRSASNTKKLFRPPSQINLQFIPESEIAKEERELREDRESSIENAGSFGGGEGVDDGSDVGDGTGNTVFGQNDVADTEEEMLENKSLWGNNPRKYSDSDKQCDEWFENMLLRKEEAEIETPGPLFSIKSSLSSSYFPSSLALGGPNSPSVSLPRGCESFSPKLPILRTTSEPWRTFDVAGLIKTPFASQLMEEVEPPSKHGVTLQALGEACWGFGINAEQVRDFYFLYLIPPHSPNQPTPPTPTQPHPTPHAAPLSDRLRRQCLRPRAFNTRRPGASLPPIGSFSRSLGNYCLHIFPPN